MPPVADQVTPVLLVPVIAAVNCFVSPVVSAALVGLMFIAITGGGAVTVTVAEADFVESATLVAVTVNVPALVGAV